MRFLYTKIKTADSANIGKVACTFQIFLQGLGSKDAISLTWLDN